MDRRISTSIIDAARPAEPVTLLGISQGAAACITYAIRHPERVARMILYGGYARGAMRRGTPVSERAYQAMVDLARADWGNDNPTFRQVFTSRFIPGGTSGAAPVVQRALPQDDLRRDRGQAAGGARRDGHLRITRRMYARRRWSCTRAVTKSCRSRKDACSPAASRGRSSSSSTRAITCCSSTSRRGSASRRRCSRSCRQDQPATNDAVFAALSARERQVLTLMAEGLGNAEIAERLQISDKTVRNHASNIFDKLGVWSRAQAIVFARDRGYTG